MCGRARDEERSEQPAADHERRPISRINNKSSTLETQEMMLQVHIEPRLGL